VSVNSTRRKERGQSLVEVALTLPILLLILSGLLDIGRVYYIYIALEEAAQEAATFLAQNPWCQGPTDIPPADAVLDNCSNPNNAEFRIYNASNQEIEPAQVDSIAYTFPEDLGGNPIIGIGSTVTVTIRYDFPLVTPLIRDALGGADGITLTATASHLIIQE
jgi:hypothetical protein